MGQEIIKWVDKDGVTHFGHAATAREAVRDRINDAANEPAGALEAADGTPVRAETAVPAKALAANTRATNSAERSE